ncbi:hypothetical protein A2701_03490 [Candidatus Amesbacteria bacterium RIFCSPHIGHO2_01_FULL_47_34]|uniref:Uncharacterized protein n=1 Tax=Candidatus Amesbacteria bacterium RIFCSPLOWO2_01_FULL_47_33 TaxID=1797258 RepID=A0A1F4Z506_9BACT|nr:MAG: hypothetical protein A2701_03490 [Candidatus Amesbacteria bacterium RIFCSPHIGHO2_01_FULL_47_34]OGD01086.1 MAG: hypothetical protein A2972_04345 [Candidatus Amesbacteria bacterium RIFCSPLOWO2_01_FULL_47_33]
MLPKNRRLNHRDFLTAKILGKNLRLPFFSVIHYSPSDSHPTTHNPARFSIVTSYKLHKHAVVRNRLRRLIYTLVSARPFPPGDYIIFPGRELINLSHEELGAVIDQVLSKISIVRHRSA